MHAGALFGAVCIRLGDGCGGAVRKVFGVGPIGIEVHGDFERAESIGEAGLHGCFLHQLHPRRPLCLRHLLDVHHFFDEVVVRLEIGIANLGRPSMFEGAFGRLRRDVRVDVRAAADRCTLRDRHVRKAPQVEPPRALLGMALIPQPLIGGLTWIVVFVPAPAALEDEHASSVFRETARRYRTAKPAADDDRVEGHGAS
jgi:hypothetical protein